MKTTQKSLYFILLVCFSWAINGQYIQVNDTYTAQQLVQNVLVGKNVEIGLNSSIGHNSIIESNVIIGDNCSIGSNVIVRNTLIKNKVKKLGGLFSP